MAKIIQASDTDGNIYLKPYFPVGYVYISMNEIDLNAIYGGTWEQISGKFLLACSDDYEAGSTGGEAEHTLTEDEMPSHTHGLYGAYDGNSRTASTSGSWDQFTQSWNTSTWIKEAGGDQPHNNMPPYLAVYMYQKIAN